MTGTDIIGLCLCCFYYLEPHKSCIGYQLLAQDHPGSVGKILKNLLDKVKEKQVKLPKDLAVLRAGSVLAGVLLGVWCGVVVGTVDNFLRPRLVGRDTKMPDLLVLVGTLRVEPIRCLGLGDVQNHVARVKLRVGGG